MCAILMTDIQFVRENIHSLHPIHLARALPHCLQPHYNKMDESKSRNSVNSPFSKEFMSMQNSSPDSSLILYQTEDGQTRIEVRLLDETVWLSQAQLCELFDKDKRTISEHIQNIFNEGELSQESVVRNFRTTATDGKNYQVLHYNLDVIISVGYRVSSHRGTQFRIWATARLKEYIVKGFALDDERLKQSGGGNYFNELLARIRDIRSSEKIFWRKVLDIYATSIDYDPKTEDSKRFFAIVQNKMHWAAHGSTAAEIIYSRANAEKTNMGLTSWSGKSPRENRCGNSKKLLKRRRTESLKPHRISLFGFRRTSGARPQTHAHERLDYQTG